MARYDPRPDSLISPIGKLLATDGISAVDPVYPADAIRQINTSVDPILKAQDSKPRAYVTVDDFVRLGLVEFLLEGRMRQLIQSITPNPVLYHCHIYEIAGNSTKSHIFSESLAGWHRDPDSEYVAGDPTHTSIFVYLTNVGSDDGAFEFSPSDPTDWVRSSTPAISVTGPAGFSFAWNRSYYHRASPNRGPRRRRLLKLSIQPNEFASPHLSNPNFMAARDMLPPGNDYLDLLFGRYQEKETPVLPAVSEMPGRAVSPTGTIGVPDSQLLQAQAREKVRTARRWLRRKITGGQAEIAAYD